MLTVKCLQLRQASQVRLSRRICTAVQEAPDLEVLPDMHRQALRSRLVAEAKADDEPD